jgi:hypothetical protein
MYTKNLISALYGVPNRSFFEGSCAKNERELDAAERRESDPIIAAHGVDQKAKITGGRALPVAIQARVFRWYRSTFWEET